MKKALIGLGVVAGLFVGGAGMMALMPYIAPEVVQSHQRIQDSLETAYAWEIPDSLRPLHSRPDTLLAPAPALPARDTLLAILHDSIDGLKTQLRDKDALLLQAQRKTDDLQDELARVEGRQQQVTELAKTLSMLDLRELEPIMQRISMRTLKQLYTTATGRSRQKILQAMPSERAARFVDQVIAGEPAPSPPPDTTTSSS